MEKWKAFAAYAEDNPNFKAKMTADIDLGDDQTMIGSSVPYKGIFDGQGHKLNVNYFIEESVVAPFRYVDGATIENLHVTGKIETINHAVGGIVGVVQGQNTSTTIRNCWSSSLMYSHGVGVYEGTIGGIVSENHGILIIEDCLFDGQFVDSNWYYNGGIVANTFYDLTIRNTLNVGNYPPNSVQSGTFYRTDSQRGTAILENVYYKSACGTSQGTAVTDEQLADGTVTALLQNGRSEFIWVQAGTTPILLLNGTDEEVCCFISSPENWKTFAAFAEEFPNVNAKMIADIDLGEDQTMIGSSVAYQGNFDGQGHTLTVNYLIGEIAAAPFRYVEGATIENLHVTGKIETTKQDAGGIVGLVYGQDTPTTIRNCWSSSLMVSQGGGIYQGKIGGIVSENNGVLVIEDCLFDGQFADKNIYYNGGIVANTFYDLTIRNTLNTGSYPPQKSSGTFYRPDTQKGTAILENVYYKNVCGTPQGTAVTDEQLADGTVNTLLQNGRSEEVWIQGNGTPFISVFRKPVIASVTTDRQLYLPGETVYIKGIVSNLFDSDIEVFVEKDGISQTLDAHVDGQGNFAAGWVPMSGQIGRFTIGVSYKGDAITENPVQVDVIGLKRTSNSYITCEATVGEPYIGTIEVDNPCLMALHLKEVEILSKPEIWDVTIEQPANIDASCKAKIQYTLMASQATDGNEWELVQLRIGTEEGAYVDATLYVYSHSAHAVLVANDSSISTTMTKGSSRDYPLYITNKGKGATGKITLSLPNVAWMTSVTPVDLPSLDYGETATIMLRLAPTDDLPLNVPQTGTIGVNCENGDGIAISYSIETVSDQNGTLIVDVVDENTEYAESHPHVSGAMVEVKHPTTGVVIAQGTTAADGTFRIELPEGYYTIRVSADRHGEYTNNVLVDPGREQTHEAFISYEAISYSWTMEETEIADEYEITTTVIYETNVHKPVLVITLPGEKPKPNEMFPVTVTNHGLINTEHVDLTAVITSGFNIDILNDTTLEVLGPEQSHTYYCVIKDEDGLWNSSCINAYLLADGYYQCHGLQHVQGRYDMYRCTLTGSDTGGGGGSWPGIGPGGPALGGNGTITGGASDGSTPWISWPCESCPARVKLQIVQTVSMSRPAYRGTLMLYNGHESAPSPMCV